MSKEGSISPQEKEKLRKRLQKLFQKEEHYDGETSAGKSSKINRSKTSKQDNSSTQMKGAKKLKFKPNKLKPQGSSTSPKNLSKQKQQQNQQISSPEENNTTTATKQNVFVKGKKNNLNNSLNKQKTNNNKPKQNGFVVTPIELNESTEQQKQNKIEKSQNKNSTPSKQQNVKKENTNSNGPQKKSKQNGFVESPIEIKESTVQHKQNKMEKSQTKNSSPSKQQKVNENTNSNTPQKKSKQNGFKETKEANKQQNLINKSTAKSTENSQNTKIASNPSKQLNENNKANSNKPHNLNKTKNQEKETNQPKQLNKQNDKKSSPTNNKTEEQANSHNVKKKPQQTDQVTKTPINTKQNNSISNKQNNQNNKQNKPPQKRTAPTDTPSQQEAPITNKKPKLSNQSNNKKETPNKSNKKDNKKFNKTKNNTKFSTSFQSDDVENEFDLTNMSGCVRGGDFDSDNEKDAQEHKYWKQLENSSSEEDSDNDSHTSPKKQKKNKQKSQKNSNTELEHYNKQYNESSDDDEEDYTDDEEHEFDDSYFFGDSDEYDYDEEEEEEEEENYSDYDENDYEEDEDSYDYSDDDEFSSNYEEEEDDEYGNNSSYDFNYHHDSDEEDDDYELPKDVPEDLVIHRGTATKRDLKPEDNVSFDSENEEAQIVELEEQDIVKVIKQPKAYEREELIKLKVKDNTKTLNAITFHRKELITTNTNNTPAALTNNNKEAEDDCPKLVPIVDEDGFQLYNPNEDYSQDEQDMNEEEQDYDDEDGEEEEEELDSMEGYDDENMDEISLGSEYEEINSDDADSIMSEDINEKYLCKTQTDYNSDESIDEEVWNRKHKADIIDATSCKYEKKKDKKKLDKEESDLNDDIKQLPSVKLFDKVNLKTASSILSTTIIDNKHFNKEDKKENNDKEKERKTKAKEKKSLKGNNNLKEQELENETKAKEKKSSKVNHNLKEQELEEEIAEEMNDENMEESLNVADNLDQDDMEESMEIEQELEQSSKAKTLKPVTQSLLDYQTKFFNALDSNLVLVLLKEPFYIYGTVRLTLLAGKLEVYGHSLELNKEVELFSPRGCSVIEISPSSNNKTKISKADLKDILKSYEKHFALADLTTIKENFNPESNAVVLLKRNEARKKLVQQFKKFMNENVFPNLNNINMDRPLYNSEYLLRCMINTSTKEQKCLKLSQQWQNLQVKSSSRIMLAGGKSVGKSTLLRYLINRHLPQQQKILLIDLDIGQPEVYIPQTVSCTVIKQPLLGPGFMLNLQPEMAFAVGHTNIALCPHKYLAAVRNLINYCKSQEEFKNLPWLINTMGYNKGFGLELLSVIPQELPLTDLIQLQSNKEINNFDSILHTHVLDKVPRLMFNDQLGESQDKEPLKYRLHVWQSAVEQESRYQKEWEMSAKDMRFAMLLARLTEALQGHAEWLTDIKPLSASLNDLKIVNLLDNTPTSSSEELAKAVEANLVYLCHYQNDNEPLKCLGIGVVRAVDLHVQQVYLIPAVAHSLLKDVNCIALGEMPLPTSLFTNQGSKVKNVAPFVYNTVADNASKAIKQIYHRPRKFLSGKHKSLD